MKYQSSLVWLRRDLRLEDHTVLAEATRLSEEVFTVFIFDTNILSKLKNKSDRRVFFIFETVKELAQAIRQHGSHLILIHGDPKVEIPQIVRRLNVEAVFAGNDYEDYAKKRDSAVKQILEKDHVAYHNLKDHVIFEGTELLTNLNTPYKVFTPYKKTWLKKVRQADIKCHTPDYTKLSSRSELKKFSKIKQLEDIGFMPTDLLYPAGEKAGQTLLKSFSKKIECYHSHRDFPSQNGTSGLSTHLRFGTISIRQAVRLCQKVRNNGSKTWLSELIWRDFYHMILNQFPHSEFESFKSEYRHLVWPGKEDHFKAWCKGQTGFPIVDAAMRDFNQSGWMHNRLRMIVASFLVKDLLISWQKGEVYFADHLLDFDRAANNGGWQWSAGTGCDAQPYFRIFNPTSQSRRFDPEGKYIRQHCPELKKFSNKLIHAPHLSSTEEQSAAGCLIGKDYPCPIVDHREQRTKILELFKK